MAIRPVIGLDIGSMSIRAVETQRTKAGYQLTRFVQAPLARGAVQGGVIEDVPVVVEALRQIWGTARFASREVVLGVTHRQVVVREMSVSNVPDRELRASLPLQVKQVLPLPVEQAVLDFCRLEDPGTAPTVRGLLIAVPKPVVLTAVQAVEQVGLQVTRVDLGSFALLRAAARLDGEVEALVDLGAKSTNVVVHADGQPLIVRTIPRGGDEITETMAKRLDTEYAEAETVKCRVGLGEDASPTVAGVVRDAVRPLVNEIRSSFAYLTAGEQHTQVTRLALAGGGSRLLGLAQALHEHLGVAVTVSDVLARLRPGPDDQMRTLREARLSAAVAVGLTLPAGGTP